MWPILVVVFDPSLHLFGRIRKGQEPVRVQALAAEASVERLDEGVVGRFPRAGEVQCDALGIGSQVEVAADELGPLIDPDRLRIAQFRADPLQRGDDILGPVAEAGIDSR